MTVELKVTNRFVSLIGADLSTIRLIDRICAYRISGYRFIPSYKSKRWDGRIHLFKFNKTHGYHAPSGMIFDIVDAFKSRKIPFEIKFDTKLHGKKLGLKWNKNIVLRDYQKESVRSILSPPFKGRGVLKLPIRSGKTIVGAKIIQIIDRPTIFIVPSQWLLYQTIEQLEKCIGVKIGQIGDGCLDIKPITVATIQTLSMRAPIKGTKKRKGRKAHPLYHKITNMFDVCIADEIHHFNGKGDWFKVFSDCDCRFKIGLSATVFFDNDTEQSNGIIWVRGTCGPIRYDVPVSRLIRDGYLLQQQVKIYRVDKPKQTLSSYSRTLKDNCIIKNQYRNNLIAKIVQENITKKTIVIANEHAHINAICEELEKLNIDFCTLTGKDNKNRRQFVVSQFVSGEINVIVGNVLSEGVDIPEIECVINAEGGKDDKKTWQRQRNLTISNNPNKIPVMIDFYDETSDYFEKHSKARIKIYTSEQEFKTEFIGWS